jgi:hypothetical protein
MKPAIQFLILSFGFYLTSCEDVIVVDDLETAPPRLVVDASINWLKGTSGNEQRIVLTTTTGYYEEIFPVVSGASVSVTNASGTVFDFFEISDTGEYVCTDFEPLLGETYTLTMLVNGETYTATETMMATPDIEDTIEQNNEGGMAGDEVEITYYYQDDSTQDNYYLIGVTSSRVAFPQYEVEDDENSQGNLMPEYYSHEDLEAGDILNLELYGISRRYHDYLKKVLVASGADGSPWPTIPSAARGNIINQTDSENYVFGYFRLCQVSTRDYTVQ